MTSIDFLGSLLGDAYHNGLLPSEVDGVDAAAHHLPGLPAIADSEASIEEAVPDSPTSTAVDYGAF